MFEGLAGDAVGSGGSPGPYDGAMPDLSERDWFPGPDDEDLLRRVAAELDREPVLVVPDDGEPYTMVRDAHGGWTLSVAGMAPGAGLAGALGRLAASAAPTGARIAHSPDVVGPDRRIDPAHSSSPAESSDPADPDLADLSGLGEVELGEVAAGCQRLMSWARALQAGVITELSRRPAMAPEPSSEKFRSVSARSCTALELSDPLKVTSGQAEQLVAESVQLVEDFPKTHAALSGGRIDERRAKVILSELGRQDRDVASVVEAAVIDRAGGMNARQLRRKIKDLVHKLAPVAAEERRRKAAQDRFVRISSAEDGMAWLEALMRAEDAAALQAVLDAGQKTLKRRDAENGDANTRTAEQRRADVLAHLAWAALATGRIGPDGHECQPDTSGDITDADTTPEDADQASTDHTDDPGHSGAPASASGRTTTPGSASCPSCGRGGSPFGTPGLVLGGAHGRPVTVNVTVPLSTLIGMDDQPGHLAGYGAIAADVARHLSVAGVWQWVGTDEVNGVVLSHGRTRYVPTQDLIDHVILRDRTCKAPGCDAPARVCDLDHTIYFPLGPTAACNLGLLCRTHHLLKHRTRWRVEQPEPGLFRWISPTGRVVMVERTQVGPVPDSPDPPGSPHVTPEPDPPPEHPPDVGDDEPPF